MKKQILNMYPEFTNEEVKRESCDDLESYIKLYSEMLDFINRISGEMLRSDFVLSEKWYDQAQEIIKKATEL